MAASVESADPEAAAAARRLMEVLELEDQMGPMLGQVTQMQEAMFAQQNFSEQQKAATRQLMAVSMAEVEKAMAWENLEKMMVKVYAGVFTREELDDLTALFETPAGQCFVEKQPKLQAAMMAEMQVLMMRLMPDIQQKTRQAMQQVTLFAD